MRKMISAVSIAALLVAFLLTGIMPAAAGSSRGNFDKQDQYIGSFCDKYRGADQCNDWRAGRTNWTSDQYRNFYRLHQNDKEFSGPEVASLFGLRVGVAVTGVAQNGGENNGGSNDHVRACESTYRSYDPRTDTFLGYDGHRHPCRV